MARNPRRVDAALDALYAELPPSPCKGLCFDSCGPIGMSVRERLRVEEASGHTLGCNGITCNMLVNNRCSVYSVRPMLCRLYGLVEGFECEHGCVPEGGLLSPEKGAEYLRRAVEIGGPITHSDPEMVRALEQLRDMLGGGSHGGFQEVVDQAMARLQSRHD